MKVTYHIGLHSTDADRALACLLENAPALREEGVAIPPPHRARTMAREAMLAGRGTPADADAQARFLAALDLREPPSRLVLSSDSFLCVPRRALETACLYPTAAERARWLRGLFPESETRICLALRNPITWLPEVHARFSAETTFTDWIGGTVLDELSWVDMVARLHAAVPDAELVLWSHEDAPLLWHDILEAMIAPDAGGAALAGAETFVCDLLQPAAAERLSEYLAQTTEASARRTACRAFLDRFARPDAMAMHLAAPEPGLDWPADLAARVTERYERDMAELRGAAEVTVLAA